MNEILLNAEKFSSMASSLRNTVTVEKRVEILTRLENGSSIDDLATEYGVSKRTIRRYKQQSVSLRQLCNDPERARSIRQRGPLYNNTEARLYEWILERRASGNILTTVAIQEKAKAFEQESGNSNFTASQGWISRFKRRYEITGLNKEETDVYQLVRRKFIANFARTLQEENIKEDNIYIMDETNVLWRSFPKMLTKDEQRVEVERAKGKVDHVTVALCTNATGTHKLPLLFVHKYPNPRALKHCKHYLPVVYASERNCSINERIFTQWYIVYFQASVKEFHLREQRKGKVLLLVDHFTQLLIPEQLREDEQFQIIFLPSFIQPMDQALISKCKKFFRKFLLKKAFEFPGGVKEFYPDYDVKDCMDLIAEAWNNIKLTDIRNSWNRLLQFTRLANNEDVTENAANEDRDPIVMYEERLTQWFERCEQAESMIQNNIDFMEETKDSTEAVVENDEIANSTRPAVEEQEMVNTFHNLNTWATSEPDDINLQVKFLIDYYNNTNE
ncbi:tigger transposable element-derived protein 2 [Ceratina calcarata]|uniref:Tigger transposable element-derived protein 2 n=1 Tax=Ceratina calcarata TaxID=156304 RepID=A0AAJ7JE49_9HYME|nr:tigger transposable element-derived protein 2 [Ceratina calcarata]